MVTDVVKHVKLNIEGMVLPTTLQMRIVMIKTQSIMMGAPIVKKIVEMESLQMENNVMMETLLMVMAAALCV